MSLRSTRVRDDIVRTMEFALETDEMLQARWAKKPFNPREATVTFRNGRFSALTVRGVHKKTDGTDARTGGHTSYYSLDEVPECLRPLVQVPALLEA